MTMSSVSDLTVSIHNCCKVQKSWYLLNTTYNHKTKNYKAYPITNQAKLSVYEGYVFWINRSYKWVMGPIYRIQTLKTWSLLNMNIHLCCLYFKAWFQTKCFPMKIYKFNFYINKYIITLLKRLLIILITNY